MKKILVVEDELAYAKLLYDQLASVGYEVLAVYDGKIGLETAIKEKPDLILLDIRMPVMDGMAMLKELREDAWGKDVNVIMLTNLDDSANISNAMEDKILRYVVKSETTLDSVIDDVKMFLKE